MAWWDRTGVGTRVTRATLTLAAATTTIFAVAGGRVIITNILGTITTLIGGLSNYYLLHDPTGTMPLSTITNLCAATNIDAYPVGDVVGITGVPTDALIPGAMASVIPSMTMEVVLPIGNIRAVSSTAPGGAILWTVWYKPLDAAGYVVAA